MDLETIQKITKDIKNASITLSDNEARFLVDAYYMMQDSRIRNGNQIRALDENKEPHDVLNWLFSQNILLENQIKSALDRYSSSKNIGIWMKSIVGIGPVISSGLMAHIDIKKAPTVGHIWNYAGLNPLKEWKKGEKRPFNATLKTICWKIGESFVKVQNHPDDYYGKIYVHRKEMEIAKNETLFFKEQAKLKLEKYNINKNTDAYKNYIQGKLPPAHIHARAKRYAVKLFLSHLHEIWFINEFGVSPPKPFGLNLEGHYHKIEPPNRELII